MIGLNSTMPPGLLPPGLPGLPGTFAPMNQMAQSQNEGSGYTPAYVPPAQIATPDAGAALAALQAQIGGNAGYKAPGIAPNSATPPAPDASAGGGPGGAPAAPGAPQSFQDMVKLYAQLHAGNAMGNLGQIGQNVATNVGNSPIGQLFAHLTGGGQAPNLGQLPPPPPQVNLGSPSIVPPMGSSGVLGTVMPPPPPGNSILGF